MESSGDSGDATTTKIITQNPIVIYPVILKRAHPENDTDNAGDIGETATVFEVVHYDPELITAESLVNDSCSDEMPPRKVLKRSSGSAEEFWKSPTEEQRATAAFDHQFDIDIEEKVIHTEQIKCVVCSELVNGNDYDEHMLKEHPGKGKYQCPACSDLKEKFFATKEEFHQHLCMEHSSYQGYFICKDCCASVESIEYLRLHVWSNHQTGSFYCDLCLHGPVKTRYEIRRHYHDEHIEGRREIEDYLKT